jgi:hypothetical protein
MGAGQGVMGIQASGFTRRDSELVLDHRSDQWSYLADLLQAAKAQGAPSDTAGLTVAVAAFRNMAPPVPSVETPRKPSLMKRAAAKLAAAKFLLMAGAAIAATGGIAVAAATGALPNSLPGTSNAAPVLVEASELSTGETGTPEHAVAVTPSSRNTLTKSPSVPNPSLTGLCQSWLSRPHVAGKADTNPAFTVLVTTAGGTDLVDDYCATLLSAAATDSTTPQNNKSETTGKPNDPPSADHTHPTGKPSDLPSTHGNTPTIKPSR